MRRRTLLRVAAPAKVNLSLRVLGTYADGYHELRTVYQSIGLHDTLTFEERRGPFGMTCDDPTIPCDSSNLVWRAAEAIARAAGGAGAPRDITIHLTKRIPAKAGLGGGSSDAAAVLRGFAGLWRVRIPRERMRAIAAPLGADVPFFLEGGTALGLGTGALLFQLVDQPPAWVTVIVPPFGVSTREAYAWFDEDGGPVRPTPDAADRLASGGARLPESGNDLQPAVARRHPEIPELTRALLRTGASYAAMSGSGSAVFGLFDARAAAARAGRRLASSGRRAIVAPFVNYLKYQTLAGV
jgi:4-diphosphocytidyl-2-C-methyl-D-erythritol kinase